MIYNSMYLILTSQDLGSGSNNPLFSSNAGSSSLADDREKERALGGEGGSGRGRGKRGPSKRGRKKAGDGRGTGQTPLTASLPPGLQGPGESLQSAEDGEAENGEVTNNLRPSHLFH